MTQQQAEQIERALRRAQTNGLRIMGRGTRKHDGARVLAVTSASQPGRWHLVAVLAGRLDCDCHAGQYGRLCQHRALAHAELKREAQAARVLVEAAEVAERAQIAARRDTSAIVRPAFSIWAS